MNDNIYERVRRIVAKYLEISTDQVRPESVLTELGIDSLATLELLFEIEDEFKITVPDDRVVGLDTVRSVCDRIEALQAAPQAS